VLLQAKKVARTAPGRRWGTPKPAIRIAVWNC